VITQDLRPVFQARMTGGCDLLKRTSQILIEKSEELAAFLE